MANLVKFRFRKLDKSSATAGLVMEQARLQAMSIPEISRMFPMREAGKMEYLEISPAYPCFATAFAHTFK